jgi:hypothetical protein
MTDETLNDLLSEAKTTYRVPPDAPFDAMWERVEREAFDAPRALVAAHGDGVVLDGVRRDAPRRRSWLVPLAGIAATLAVGFGLGRFSAADGPVAPGVVASGPAPAATVVAPASAVAEPLQRATYEYLARAVALLDSMPRSTGGASLGGDARFVADASQLLSTTRLLLDSPAASDPRMRDLLEDLELVLAQVARLRSAPRADELTFIAEAMDERDMVPRLRTVTASYTASGY